MKIKEVLERAEDIVLNQRQKEYSQVSKTAMHSRIAEVWSGILGKTVTAHEVALCMVGLKLVRAASQPGHEDSYVDAVGYATIAAEIMHEDVTTIATETVPASQLTVLSGSLCDVCGNRIKNTQRWRTVDPQGRRAHDSCLDQLAEGGES